MGGKRYLRVKEGVMVAQLTLLDRMIDFMAGAPSPQDIMDIKATPAENERITYLLKLNTAGKISREEEKELDAILMADHMMIRAKAIAYGKLNGK